jgi:arylsulfatase A-like enzyme
MLNRRQFLAGATAVAALGATKSAPPPPSVVLVAIEDLGAWMTGVYGARDLHTPNLDLLAASGTRFLHAFTAAPVAKEGFDSLMTGTAAGTGDTILQLLSLRGFRELSAGGDATAQTSALLSFLDQQKSGQPFFAVARYAPLRETSKTLDKYRAQFADVPFTRSGWLPAARNALDRKPFESIVPHLREAAAAVAAVDDQLGAIQRKLQERGLADGTLLVIAGANGALLGRHGLWGDGHATNPPNMFEEVVAVPLVWNWPAQVPPGSLRPEIVSLCDVLPTLCELTGTPVPSPITGRSMVRAVLDRPYPKKQRWPDLACARMDGTLMARDARYKLVLRIGGPGELYDLANDPAEAHNRFDEPEFSVVRNDLTRELSNWK